MVNIAHGTRQDLPSGVQTLARVIDGNQQEVLEEFYSEPHIFLERIGE